MADPIELEISGSATGGRGVAREATGRVVFVDGALPGEVVLAEITEERRSFAEGRVVEVVVANQRRREPPCPLVRSGCGGCDHSHAEPSLQREIKRAVVVDCLTRIGKLPALPPIVDGPELAVTGFRTNVRAAVDRSGRAGIRARHRHHPVVGDVCGVAHPLAEELLVHGRYGGADEVTIRVGANTGERMVVVDGRGSLREIVVPDGVEIVSAASPGRAAYHEVVDGREFKVSARSFFQSRADGAEALVDLVRAALGSAPGPPARLVDLCAGVGLFAATVRSAIEEVVAVEPSKSAVADARANLPATATVVRTDLERWKPTPADAVVADPPRTGLGRTGAERIGATGATSVVLVSCDPASLGRDAGLLVAAGYELTAVTVVDMFPDTHHVETVSTFRRR